MEATKHIRSPGFVYRIVCQKLDHMWFRQDKKLWPIPACVNALTHAGTGLQSLQDVVDDLFECIADPASVNEDLLVVESDASSVFVEVEPFFQGRHGTFASHVDFEVDRRFMVTLKDINFEFVQLPAVFSVGRDEFILLHKRTLRLDPGRGVLALHLSEFKADDFDGIDDVFVDGGRID
jgi:hypothetical protein